MGRFVFKCGGGLGGNNGLRSVASALGTPDFGRLRVGIGRPDSWESATVASYVLGPVPVEDLAAIEQAWQEQAVGLRLLNGAIS